MEFEALKTKVVQLLEETFETHYGYYLYKGDSLFNTLSTLSAAEASVPIGGHGPTLAAQTAHTRFYIEVIEKSMRGDNSEADWDHIWKTVGTVSEADWDEIQADLKAAYERVIAEVRGATEENSAPLLHALEIIVHSAYHLGGIRQALYVLKPA